jgi:catechol 2,3-dioxygenase-like lactoylglutathione lyase family enzyme
MPILGLRHLALRVADPQASKRFYCDSFGMAVVWEPDPDNVYLSSGCDNLALHRAVTPEAGPSTTSASSWTPGTRWTDRPPPTSGVAMAEAPRDHRDGSRSFYCLDPDGWRIQVLFEPTLSRQTIR